MACFPLLTQGIVGIGFELLLHLDGGRKWALLLLVLRQAGGFYGIMLAKPRAAPRSHAAATDDPRLSGSVRIDRGRYASAANLLDSTVDECPDGWTARPTRTRSVRAAIGPQTPITTQRSGFAT